MNNFDFTILYVAPEALLPETPNNTLELNYDPSSPSNSEAQTDKKFLKTSKLDCWSIGCVLAELSTGKEVWKECNFENGFTATYHISNDKKKARPFFDKAKLGVDGTDFAEKLLRRDPKIRMTSAAALRHEFLKSEEPIQLEVDD